MTARKVLLEPGNPHDFPDEELTQLITAIQSQFPGATVDVVRRPERGYGVTLQEVLHVWDVVTDVVGDVTTVATPFALIVDWLRRRWFADRHAGRVPRPRNITLYGPDDRPLKRVLISEPDAAVIEEDVLNDTPRTRPALEEQGGPAPCACAADDDVDG